MERLAIDCLFLIIVVVFCLGFILGAIYMDKQWTESAEKRTYHYNLKDTMFYVKKWDEVPFHNPHIRQKDQRGSNHKWN